MKTKFILSSPEHYFRTRLIGINTSSYDEVIEIDPAKQRQVMQGFGGAFTDAAAHVYATLSKKDKQKVIDLYFSPKGLGYTMGRMTIGSCDFSVGEYDYLPTNSDSMEDFSLAHDKIEILPFLTDAEQYGKLRLIAASWSPLARWKDNQEKCHGGKLLPECYDIYAEYLAKYVDAMKEEGHPIAMITPQNEPEAIQTWESCIYTPEEEGKLVLALKKHLSPDVLIYGWDHNRDRLLDRCEGLFKDPHVEAALIGIAYHWYDGKRWDLLAEAKRRYPDKHFLFTEGCVELRVLDYNNPSAGIGRYHSALRYFENYLMDTRSGSEGFIDWNLLLDEKGGPNHVGNYCEAPIMWRNNQLSIQPSYYAIKHFSHFVRPGAVVLDIPNPKTIEVVGFLNPDGSIVIEMLNQGPATTVAFQIHGNTIACHLDQDNFGTLVVSK